MDPYLFFCTLGLTVSVINGQRLTGQTGNRFNFPTRTTSGGMTGTGTSLNGQVSSVNSGGGGTETGMSGQGTGMTGMSGNGMSTNGMNSNQNNGGSGMGQNSGGGGGPTMSSTAFIGENGGNMMSFDSSFIGGGGNGWMRMNMMSNSDLPPLMMTGRNFNQKNWLQYRACEKTPSSFNYICNPRAANQCQSGMLTASLPMGMFGRQRNLFVCSRMTEHGLARCCAKNVQIARMLDKMFK